MQRKSKIGSNVVIGPHAKIGKGVTITGNSVIADTAYIGDGCSVDNSFICGTTVLIRSTVRNSTIRGSSIIHRGSEIYASDIDSCAVRGALVVNSEAIGSIIIKSLNHRKLSNTIL